MRTGTALGVVALLAAGCSSATSGSTATNASSSTLHATTTIVDAASVPEIIATDHPVILSAQSVQETGPSGFVRGATVVDEDQWDTDSDSQDKLENLGTWRRLIGDLGIGDHTTVLVYDDGELKFASRVRFLLYHFGVQRALLVNGGWPALEHLAAEGKLSTQAASSVLVRRAFAVHVTDRPIPIVWRSQVKGDLHQKGVLLVDVRTPAEYDGTKLQPPVVRGGHIPGAINLPATDLLTPGDRDALMGWQGLLGVFHDHGVVPGERIVVYCHDGARSSLVASALTQLGYPSVDLYYLSYVNWQSDPNLPVAT
jgi:thiosulfate/3-mercaptopyruvate sulfurtransferase